MTKAEMEKKYYLGIDVGGTFTKLALVNRAERIKAREQISSRGFSNKTFFLSCIKKGFLKILSEAHLSLADIKAIGVGVPGPVDTERGVVLSLTNIKGWHNFHLAAYLKKSFLKPVFVENDANCLALAEVRKGAAQGASYALCLTLGTGVGGGLILDGKIYHSPFFLGGEAGHIPVASGGPRCNCGGVGCLERFVGNRALLTIAKREFKRVISLEEVSALARAGHGKACKIWREAGSRIGLAISGVVNVFNPEVIVVGGGVSLAGDVLLSTITAVINRHAMGHLKSKIKIKRALLGNEAGVLGAALLAKEEIEAGCSA